MTTALTCAALDPELRGVLLFDLRPEIVVPLGRRLADSLADTTGRPRVVHVGSSGSEDALWSSVAPQEGRGIRVSPGRLVGLRQGPPPVVVAADLARLGLAERRAAIMLLGAEVAHLERNGLTRTWPSLSRWVAACARADAGRVSPHLLDRFPIRINARGLTAESVNGAPQARPVSTDGRLAGTPAEVIRYVTTLTGSTSPGVRRELALARLARALATLRGQGVTTVADVDAAASLMGLFEEMNFTTDIGALDLDGLVGGTLEPTAEQGVTVREVAEADGPEPLQPGDHAIGGEAFTPYPEDAVEVRRDPGSLRPSPARKARSALDGGWPIGTRDADHVDDIAIVATFLEAARHQAVRCPVHDRARHAMHMRAADLRSYRRAMRPRKLLTLVLDHTCRAADWDWSGPLAPYLQWAYSSRATVCVVEVGSREASCEARAQRFVAANLLDPRVLHALDRPPGRCTPLAHGLELAASLLRDRVHRGRLPSDDALLVVVTDGRGNVPLDASRRGTLPDFTGSEGFQDSLRAARTIRTIGHIDTVVVAPGPRHNTRLTDLLSEALGAQLIPDRVERRT
ncbi:hypothetical protein ACH35V_32450 [Actinomadura sp. 1N219]|uniref:hypothetical protein n=1 Tax=Actinomadura sp. 1N219 TaxID=3375152 RepID=UPI0037B3D104